MKFQPKDCQGVGHGTGPKMYHATDECAPRGVFVAVVLLVALVAGGVGFAEVLPHIGAAVSLYPEAFFGAVGGFLIIALAVYSAVERYRSYRSGWGVYLWIAAALLCVVVRCVMTMVGI